MTVERNRANPSQITLASEGETFEIVWDGSVTQGDTP